ncbi:unnamed protein product [Acidithrix sp. C25]|nr:unnamed protein product [Acidithrix sp. C25]
MGALLVCMSGPIVSNLNLDMFNPFMDSLFLVLAISRVIRARGNRRVGWLLILAFLVSQLFLSGFDEVVPLLAIMIFFFMIALLTKNGYKLRHSMGLVTAIIISCILGLVGSAIATASLYGAISTSAALQSPNGWKHHSPISWLVTLVDPWFFGKGVIGGIYQGTFAEWAWGNPILWSLAALGTVAIIKDLVLSRGKYQLWHRIILGFALFGFLADFNFAYVDALFSLPILRLIALPRFLPFMWWLPLVVLAAIGFEAIRSATQLVRVCGFIFPLLFYVALDLFIHVQGSRAFPVLTAPVVAAFSSQFIFYIFCLVGLVIVVLFDRLAWSEISLAGLVVVSLFVYLPRNFFPTPQAVAMSAPIARVIKSSKFSHAIFLAPGDLLLPSVLAMNDLSSIQGLGIFFPKGYVNTLKLEFGNAPTHSSLSPLWPLAPSLYNVAIDYGSLKSLNLMGVGGLILGQKMATSYEVVDSSLPAPFGKNRQVTSALSALLGVYYSRPDLGAAFNLDSRSISLLKWATGISSGDSSYSRLHPNREIYLKVLSQEQSDPKISLFTSIDVASQWQYGGSVTFNGV